MDISNNAFVSQNSTNIEINDNGQLFRSNPNNDSEISIATYNPAVCGQVIRFGFRLHVSKLTLLSYGLCVSNHERDSTSFVLYDLVNNEYITQGRRMPTPALPIPNDGIYDLYIESNDYNVKCSINGTVVTFFCPISNDAYCTPVIIGTSFEFIALLCYEVDDSLSIYCDVIPKLQEKDINFGQTKPILLKAKPTRTKEHRMLLRTMNKSPPSDIILPSIVFSFTSHLHRITSTSYKPNGIVCIESPFDDLKKSEGQGSFIIDGCECYVSRFGLTVTNKNTWMEQVIELKDCSVDLNIGCLISTKKNRFDLVRQAFRGTSITAKQSPVIIRLEEQDKKILLIVKTKDTLIYKHTVDSTMAFPALWYTAEPFMALRLYCHRIHVSSRYAVTKWISMGTNPVQLNWQPTFINEIMKTNTEFKATKPNRIITIDKGCSAGTAELCIQIGSNPIKGIGVCCRPVNEQNPLDDKSVLYYDLHNGCVVGGIDNGKKGEKAHAASLVILKIDFDLCIIRLLIDSKECCFCYCDDSIDKPAICYPCILFSQEGQSFENLTSILKEGYRLGDTTGGDYIIYKALNYISDNYLKRITKQKSSIQKTLEAIKHKRLQDASSLTLLGNGAVCSAYAVNWKHSTPLAAIIVKRIHPYLHTHLKEEAWTNDEYQADWRKGCDSYDYVKSFLLDYNIPHDLVYHYFINTYDLRSDLLQYTLNDGDEDNYDKNTETYYMVLEPMELSLDAYIKKMDTQTGMGCYNALLILLRLSLCLTHLYQYEIVHNDLKADNIMIKDENYPTMIRLIDFGESFVGFDVLSTSSVVNKGNVHFKAPELSRHYLKETVINSSRADVWSLAILAYTLLGIEIDPKDLINRKYHFELFESMSFGNRMREFITRVAIANEDDRPDAMECVRILMHLVFNIPEDELNQINYVCEKAIEIMDDVTTPSADLDLLIECIYVLLNHELYNYFL